MESGCVDRRTENRNFEKYEIGDKIVDIRMIKWFFVERLYQVYEKEVYKTCLHFAKDEHIAKDMTQKTFLSIYDHYDNIRPGRTKPYLIRTAKNITMNYLRDFKRLQDGQIEDLNEENLKVLSVEDMYIREESAALARKLGKEILTKLYDKNKKWHDAIVMAYYFEIPQGVIAENLGVDPDVIYSRLYRAKKWIRQHYQHEYDNYIKLIED